jgi:hypothetical protein
MPLVKPFPSEELSNAPITEVKSAHSILADLHRNDQGPVCNLCMPSYLTDFQKDSVQVSACHSTASFYSKDNADDDSWFESILKGASATSLSKGDVIDTRHVEDAKLSIVSAELATPFSRKAEEKDENGLELNKNNKRNASKRSKKTKNVDAKTKNAAPSFQFPFVPSPRAKTPFFKRAAIHIDINATPKRITIPSDVIEKRDNVATRRSSDLERYSLVENSTKDSEGVNLKKPSKSTSIEKSEICDFESEAAWEDDGTEFVSVGGCYHMIPSNDDASSYIRRGCSPNNSDTETTWDEDGIIAVPSWGGWLMEGVSRSIGATFPTRSGTKSYHADVIPEHILRDDVGTVDRSVFEMPATNISRSANCEKIVEEELSQVESIEAEYLTLKSNLSPQSGTFNHAIRDNVSSPDESKTHGLKVNSIWQWAISRDNAAPTYPSTGLKIGQRRRGSLNQSFHKSLQRTEPKSRAIAQSSKLEQIMEEKHDIHRVSEEIPSRNNSDPGARNPSFTNNSKTNGVKVNTIWSLGTSRGIAAPTYPSTNFKRGRRRRGRLHQSFHKSLQKTDPKSRATEQSSKLEKSTKEETQCIHLVSGEIM